MERRPRQLVIARHGGGMTSHFSARLAMSPGFRQVKDLRTQWRRRWRTSTRQGWPARTKRRCMLGRYCACSGWADDGRCCCRLLSSGWQYSRTPSGHARPRTSRYDARLADQPRPLDGFIAVRTPTVSSASNRGLVDTHAVCQLADGRCQRFYIWASTSGVLISRKMDARSSLSTLSNPQACIR